MNAYMYHMLLRAREVWYKNRSVLTSNDLTSCPFCTADCDNAYHQAKENLISYPLDCWSCPLLSTAHSHDQQLDILMDCHEYGRQLLRNYEESAGPVPEEEILC